LGDRRVEMGEEWQTGAKAGWSRGRIVAETWQNGGTFLWVRRERTRRLPEVGRQRQAEAGWRTPEQ